MSRDRLTIIEEEGNFIDWNVFGLGWAVADNFTTEAVFCTVATATVFLNCEILKKKISNYFAGKDARALQREGSFSSEKLNDLTDQKGTFWFNHTSAFYTSNNIVKNVD